MSKKKGKKTRANRDRFSLVCNLKQALSIPNGTARGFALIGIAQNFPEFSASEIDSIIETIPHSPPKFYGSEVSIKFEEDRIVGVYS